MNRVGRGIFRSADDLGHVEVAGDEMRFLRQTLVKRSFINCSKDHCGFDSHFAEGIRNPDGNFAAVRDQNFADH